MKYTGRITITIVSFVFIVATRVYFYIYYNFPLKQLPFIGGIGLLIFWWLGSQYDKIKFYSEKDVLTGIYNRRFVIQALPRLLAQMNKRKANLTFFLIDVDNFKQINDAYGHETGDRVLQSISKILVSGTVKKDIVARWAGDEFLIISPYSNAKTDDGIIEQIHSRLNKLSEELNILVTVSIGTSIYPNDGITLNELLNIADRVMYAMKADPVRRSSGSLHGEANWT